MKRFVSVMLIVAMLVGSCAMAEEKLDLEQCKKNLGLVNLAYKVNPDKLDDDIILFAYLNLMFIIHSDTNKYFNQAYGNMEKDGGKMMETVRKLGYSSARMANAVSGAYMNYIEGKFTREQLLDIMMPIVDGMLETDK